MGDPNITMEEYSKLQAEKAQRHGRMFNWEITTYGKVYCDNLEFFTDFEADFPSIVYNDALTSNQNVSSEPTNSFSYKLIPVDDLKPEPVNNHVEINTELCLENIDIKPMDSVDTTPVESDEHSEINHDEKNEWKEDALQSYLEGQISTLLKPFTNQLERPNWDAADYYFKEDYNDRSLSQEQLFSETEMIKIADWDEWLQSFSDWDVVRVMEKLDQMVNRTFICYEYNKGMETRKPHKGVKASANSDVMYFFTSAQDGDPSQDDVRLCLGDDLKKAQDHSQRQAGDLP
ncbi:hypothetical protein Tco_0398052 [Tanacetum coccineum]